MKLINNRTKDTSWSEGNVITADIVFGPGRNRRIKNHMDGLLNYLRENTVNRDSGPDVRWNYLVAFSQPRPTGDVQAMITLGNGRSTWRTRAAHSLSTTAFLRALHTLQLTLSHAYQIQNPRPEATDAA